MIKTAKRRDSMVEIVGVIKEKEGQYFLERENEIPLVFPKNWSKKKPMTGRSKVIGRLIWLGEEKLCVAVTRVEHNTRSNKNQTILKGKIKSISENEGKVTFWLLLKEKDNEFPFPCEAKGKMAEAIKVLPKDSEIIVHAKLVMENGNLKLAVYYYKEGN